MLVIYFGWHIFDIIELFAYLEIIQDLGHFKQNIFNDYLKVILQWVSRNHII